MNDWLTYLSIFIAGVVVGFLFLKTFLSAKDNQSVDLKNKLDEMKNEHHQYQESVTEHFNKTADLIENLNQNYQAIQEHINSGAQDLISQEYRLANFEPKPKEPLVKEAVEQITSQEQSAEHPLDYAPKPSQEAGLVESTIGERPTKTPELSA